MIQLLAHAPALGKEQGLQTGYTGFIYFSFLLNSLGDTEMGCQSRGPWKRGKPKSKKAGWLEGCLLSRRHSA